MTVMSNLKRPTRPADLNQRAHPVFPEAFREAPTVSIPVEPEPEPVAKNPHAVALGKLGGSKGGKATAAKMTPEERDTRAALAAAARWRRAKEKGA